MNLENEYLGRIDSDEAREAYSRAESDCEYMPSAAWRALCTVGQMHYEYMVQANDREWVRENDEGQFVLTFDPMRALRHCHPSIATEIAKAASAKFSCECRVVCRLVGEPEVVE